jgi:hypothetical protein
MDEEVEIRGGLPSPTGSRASGFEFLEKKKKKERGPGPGNGENKKPFP